MYIKQPIYFINYLTHYLQNNNCNCKKRILRNLFEHVKTIYEIENQNIYSKLMTEIVYVAESGKESHKIISISILSIYLSIENISIEVILLVFLKIV